MNISFENRSSIASVTPTLCKLMGIPAPSLSSAEILTVVLQAAQREFGTRKVEKCLVYAPDALGATLYHDRRDTFIRILPYAPLPVPLRSVVPPKTPVCFASMFTGALPEAHGIRTYEKPVLSCDTLFDTLVRSHKRVAIVAVTNSSIDRIFRTRALDYFSEQYDEEVTQRTLALLEANEYDFIVAYHQEYDDAMHATIPQSKEALQALENHIVSFNRVARAFLKCWSRHNRLILFAPDHGAHVDAETGKGTHGAEIPDDMYVYHFFGFEKSANPPNESAKLQSGN